MASPSLSSMAANFPQPPRGVVRPLDVGRPKRHSSSAQPNYALRTSWAAPPTPQDSQASEASDSAPPSPTVQRQLPPMTPLRPAKDAVDVALDDMDMDADMDSEDDDYYFEDGGAPFKGAALPTPEQTPPSPRQYRATIGVAAVAVAVTVAGTPLGTRGRDARMQQWLTDIPSPMSPQERYIQGLDPLADHPLHPRPLRVSVVRQSRPPRSSLQHADVDGHDKENVHDHVYAKAEAKSHTNDNANPPCKLSSFGPDHVPGDRNALENRKRHMSEYPNELLARKRTKMLDPVRRFSQKVTSSLALSPIFDDANSTHRYSETMSPEDAARQSEQLYRFRRVSKPQQRRGSIRASLSKRPGSLRVSGSDALRRMMQKPQPPAISAPIPVGGVVGWADGRPDMMVNVAFIGDAHVGKTALIRRLVHGTFPQTYEPSDIQESTLRMTMNDIRVQINLSEAGSGHDANQPSLLAHGWFSVVVLCFDIGRQSSLETLKKYRNEIAMYEENAIVLLAGLKKDARHRLPPLSLSPADEELVQVSTEEGEQMAAKMRCDRYFECSALGTCEGMDDMFDYVVKSGMELQKSREKKMARFRLEHSVDKGMAKIADGVRSLFLFPGN